MLRIAVGSAVQGWTDCAIAASPVHTPECPTRTDEPRLLYFNNGTTAEPERVEHAPSATPSAIRARCTGSVVPSSDALKLAVPKAFVTLTAGHVPDEATARSILAFCGDRLAA